MNLEVQAPDGRRLEVEVSGVAGDGVVLFHTGTPSAGRLFEPMVRAAAERGLRHVCYSRPGYGRSDRRAGRAVEDCIGDVAAITDHLGIDRFYTVGWSGGGPHALACAALLEERVIACATIGAVAPRGAEGLDWFAGMGQENIEEFTAASAGEKELAAWMDMHAPELARASTAELQAVLGDLLSEVDREVLAGPLADYLVRVSRHGLLKGYWGWFDDDIAFAGEWGFDLAGISRPVAIWQGEHDQMVPSPHARWLAAHVAGARSQLLAEHGHFSLPATAYDQVLDELIAAG